ncbi:hypothetical protein JOQ06_013232 [Pogonophryne albipinna]|uniref:Family with sequence similarity 114 member A1 n=1 Tax=Pogonophryne albipinna TaxID=1090488 RepID=A0AAD6FQY2_9TELE|nr:hypothetical protein JOQ06_013232 [Pogonophryne albipinna]
MSQADTDPFADISSPPTEPLHPDPGSCQDVPAAFASPPASLQPPLIPESFNLPRSTTEETTTEDMTTEANPSEGLTEQPGPAAEGQVIICDQPEPAAEGQVILCDQPVSLEPDAEAVKEDLESSLQETEKGWGVWSSWGKSLINSATSSVGQSLTSVKTKAGEALRLHKTSVGEEAREEEDAVEEQKTDGGEGGDPELSVSAESPVSAAAPGRGVFSSITHAMQNTGKSVISGGLDALEFIGKKTMTVLAESDPGFKKTKTLMQKTVSLSQMLKEAKEKERARLGNQPISVPTAHYGILFDDYQGLSHLEALEILSNESEAKVQAFLSSLVEEEQDEVKKELIVIKNIFINSQLHCSTPLSADGEEFLSVLTELLFELHVAATPDKLNKARMRAQDWVSEVEQPVSTETICRGCLPVISQQSCRSDGSQLTCAMCKEVECLAKKFSDTLLLVGGQRKAEELNPLVNDVLLEGSNSTNYIENALQLLLPVLQISHIQSQQYVLIFTIKVAGN